MKSEIRLKLTQLTPEAATFTLLETVGARIVCMNVGDEFVVATEARVPVLTVSERRGL